MDRRLLFLCIVLYYAVVANAVANYFVHPAVSGDVSKRIMRNGGRNYLIRIKNFALSFPKMKMGKGSDDEVDDDDDDDDDDNEEEEEDEEEDVDEEEEEEVVVVKPVAKQAKDIKQSEVTKKNEILSNFMSKNNNNNNNNRKDSLIIPKLAPHEDSCYLLEFHSDNNDYCEQMEPVLQRLEDDLGTKIRRINIFRRREFMSLLDAIGHDECGTLPFYYNRRTGQAICGATSYLNLKRWGTGDLKLLFQDPPENLYEIDTETHVKKGDVGFKGFITDKLKNGKKGKSISNAEAKK